MGISYFYPLLGPRQERERDRDGNRKIAGTENTGESSRLRGATYWTKLAHIKQGSNWNSGGIRGSPRPGSRALSVPLEMVPSGLEAGLGNETLDCASPIPSRSPRLRASISSSFFFSSFSPVPVCASSDITPPRSLSARSLSNADARETDDTRLGTNLTLAWYNFAAANAIMPRACVQWPTIGWRWSAASFGVSHALFLAKVGNLKFLRY